MIDLASEIYETGVVVYIPWEKCTKRDQEMVGAKSDRVWKPDANGNIREISEQKSD